MKGARISVLANLTNLEATVSGQKRYLKTNFLIIKQAPWSPNAKYIPFAFATIDP